MKITDFRTGNFYTDGSNILIVRLIDNYPSSGDKINNTPLLEEYIKPIPLTEEWLYNFDLIKRNYTENMPEDFRRPDIDEDGNFIN
jgi:hypothetical protein